MKPLQKIYTNSTYPLKLVYKDAFDVPIDITGASAKLAIRRTLFSAAVIYKSAVITGPSGEITFTITPEDTATVLKDADSEKFLVGAVLTLADGNIVTLFQTTVDVVQNIVRP